MNTIFYLEDRGGYLSLYHFFIYNLGGLYYILNNQFDVRHTDSIKIKNKYIVENPTQSITHPIIIYVDKKEGPISNIIKEAFEIIKDTYIYIDELPQSDLNYEIISIYGEPCYKNTASNNPDNVFPFLRNLFLSRIINNKLPVDKIKFFICRKNLNEKNTYHTKTMRTILNETEFVENLKKYNILCIYLEELTLYEKIKLFYNADLIISTNSSALTCLLWSNINTKVVEIINKPIGCGNGNHYKLICDTLHIKYYRYSDIIEDSNGNIVIEKNNKIYDFIYNIISS